MEPFIEMPNVMPTRRKMKNTTTRTTISTTVVVVLAVATVGQRFGDRQRGRIMAITFDDLPANTTLGADVYDDILSPIVSTLTEASVPATGFVNEGKLYEGDTLDPSRVALLEKWLDAGLPLGNHGFGHLDLHRTPVDQYLDDIDRGGRVTSALLGERDDALRYFRHPMLHTGRSLAVRDSVVRFLAHRDMRVAPVTIDNHEWIFARAYERAQACDPPTLATQIAQSYLAYMDTVTAFYESQSRDFFDREIPQVMLLHANRLNADWLPELLDVFRNRGYRFVSLDEAVVDPVYTRPDTFTGSGGITWIHRWALTAGYRGAAFAGEPGVPPLVDRAYQAEDVTTLCAARGK
jgi:peptidoglycan/xylan/chitin deacetylase (PgdA/CDA1 family)